MPVPTVRLAAHKDIEIELNRVLSLLYEQVRVPPPVSVFQSVRGNIAEGVQEREIFLELDIGVKRLCVKHNGHIYYVNLSDPTVTNQQPAITSFTDNSGGTADNTIAAAGAGYSQSDENNFRADVAQKINAILTAIRTHGLIAT